MIQEKGRQLMNKRNDIRSTRSKYFIRKAMVELLEHHTLEEISVADISEKAEVSRRTFYIYYASKKDCLLFILDELMDEMFGDQVFHYDPDSRHGVKDAWLVSLQTLIQVIHDNRVLIQAMFRDLSVEEWMPLIQVPYDDQMEDFWDQLKENENIPDSILQLCKTIDCMQMAMYMNFIAASNITPEHGLDNIVQMLQIQKKRRLEWETALFGSTVSLPSYM